MTKSRCALLALLLLAMIALILAMGWTWDDGISKAALGFFDGN